MSCRIGPATRLYSIKPFEYLAPSSLVEALSDLERVGNEAKIIAGGTDLVPSLKLRLTEQKYIIDLSRVKELDFIESSNGQLRIGALTKHSALERSPHVREAAYVLAEAASQIGSSQIRNMGTVGGNLANASPCSDTATPLLALEADVKLVNSSSERAVSLQSFFTGVKKTVLQSDELLTEIRVPVQSQETGAAFIKVGRRSGPELAIVSSAAAVTLGNHTCEGVRIALGSVAPTPFRAKKAESFLTGRALDEESIREASEIASEEISPISDVRASAEYRREITKVIVEMVIKKAIERSRRRSSD
jgi:carbon-monoxide dehydrogenase medium subunit